MFSSKLSDGGDDDYDDEIYITKRTSFADEYRRKGIDPYVVMLDNNVIKNRVGRWFIGVRQLTPSEYDLYSDDNEPPAPAAFTGRITSNFTLITYTSGCYHCQPSDLRWSSSGCTVCSLTASY